MAATMKINKHWTQIEGDPHICNRTPTAAFLTLPPSPTDPAGLSFYNIPPQTRCFVQDPNFSRCTLLTFDGWESSVLC